MKILIPGGSGQVGTILARAFHEKGHEVVVLSREPVTAPWRVISWDGTTLGAWTEELDGSDIVINLAGRSVNCRYTAANRKAIMDSRIDSTRIIGKAIGLSKHPPRLWLQASTATIYAHRFDAPNDEFTGLIGGNELNVPDTWKFSIDVAKAWERELNDAKTPQTRKVAFRSAMIMSPDAGGVFDTLLGLVRKGLGGKAGDGKQYVSWIHFQDFIRAINWLIEHDEIVGAVNLATPNPLPNEEFMHTLRDAAGIRFGLPALKPMLDIGAIFMQTETELVLKSRRVVPGRLMQEGFNFDFPNWEDAAKDLLRQ